MNKQTFYTGVAACALLGISATGNPLRAAEPIKLSVGGYFKEAYQIVIDEDDDASELGFDRNTDGFFNDAEIHFKGSTVLDNGLEVGARVELEGETENEEGGDQIDEAWVFFSGGFGEVRIGSEDDALANSCIVPPGGTGNFSAFSPNQWGANTGGATFFGTASNSICTGVDAKGDAQKIVYITPNFSGFQLTVSYTPDEGAETHNDGAGPHLGMTSQGLGASRHNFSVYGTYSYEGEGWGLTAGLGGSFEGHVDETPFAGDGREIDEQDFYQAGLNLTFGNFAVGVAGEYFNDAAAQFDKGSDSFFQSDIWVVGIGAAYTLDAWTFGAQYSHREEEVEADGFFPSEDIDAQQDRAVLTAVYALGPGIQIDGEIAYTWTDTDPNEFVNPGLTGDDLHYDAFEIGIGTNITF